MARGLYLKALQAYQKVLEMPSESHERARLGLFGIYFSRGFTREAFGELARVHEMNPGSLEGWALYQNLKKNLPDREQENPPLLWPDYEPREEDRKKFLETITGRRDLLAAQTDECLSLLEKFPSEPYLSYSLLMYRKREEELAAFISDLPGSSPSPGNGQGRVCGGDFPPVPPEDAAEAEGRNNTLMKENFESLGGELGRILDGPAQGKGVTGIALSSLDAESFLVRSRETPDVKSMIREIKAALDRITSWENKDGKRKLMQWVMDFEGGGLIVQPVNEDFILIVTTQKGANFGTIRSAMERMKPKLEEVLTRVALPAGR